MSDVEQWEHDEQRAMETAREKEGGRVMRVSVEGGKYTYVITETNAPTCCGMVSCGKMLRATSLHIPWQLH